MSLSQHHAYVAYGSPMRSKELAALLVRELGLSAAHNPDIHVRQFENLGVDDARELTALAALSSAGGKKLFVIAAQSLTREAQNALLKTLEEPTADTYFALLVPHGALIATVRSRLVAITLPTKKSEKGLAEEFIAAAPAARSKLISKVVEDKEKHAARELIDGLESLLRKDIKKAPIRHALTELSQMRAYLMGPSPSVKMILEHLALVVPVQK